MSVYQLESVFPSSVLPTISGTQYPSGYTLVPFPIESYENKQILLYAGSGLFTGNFLDFRQDRDFNETFLIDDITGANQLGKKLQGFEGKGINRYYTSPESYAFGNTNNQASGLLYGPSGLFITFAPSGNQQRSDNHPEFVGYDGSRGSGIFNFRKLLSDFSNAEESKEKTGAAGIDDFTIFNDYIHYLPFEEDTTGGGTGGGSTQPLPGGGTASTVEEDREVRIPFVADLVATDNVWDRYGTGQIDDEEDQEETDPDYGNDTNKDGGVTGDG